MTSGRSPLPAGSGGERPTRLEWIVASVRVLVVLSIGVLLLAGPDASRRHLTAALTIFAVALVYACASVFNLRWELSHTRAAWVLTVVDATLALLVVGSTGGAASPAVSILVLVVVAAAIRLGPWATFLLTAVLAAAYTMIALWVDDGWAPLRERGFQAGWWAAYLVFIAALGGSLSILAERERHARLLARVEAEAEHAAAEEERDLRARLLNAYQAQQDGLRVILHEFRTPVSSLGALTRMLAEPSAKMSEEDRRAGLRLAAEHVEHLADMLDALGDVAASRAPEFGAGRTRSVDLREFLLAAGDAVGLRPPRLRLELPADPGPIRIDAQRLRRVLINLLENAARHSGDEPVEVRAATEQGTLVVSVSDRGPGVPPEHLGEITGKFVSLGGRHGTAGLGLWIVQQILQAIGGSVHFDNRPGGGLVATCEVPVR
ncbi:HAMP domain-containing sensor histidine kinase [Actinocorallia sp. B10E7]|uniref:sensor histidine kinase n=1 Tax=Actinocorallia sp. B10E7 TaxID=3153558 RepID=UPI00325F326E